MTDLHKTPQRFHYSIEAGLATRAHWGCLGGDVGLSLPSLPNRIINYSMNSSQIKINRFVGCLRINYRGLSSSIRHRTSSNATVATLTTIAWRSSRLCWRSRGECLILARSPHVSVLTRAFAIPSTLSTRNSLRTSKDSRVVCLCLEPNAQKMNNRRKRKPQEALFSETPIYLPRSTSSLNSRIKGVPLNLVLPRKGLIEESKDPLD
jgi:hypothetical protein